MTTTIRIGYVPEHFSTPLYIARDLGYFKDTGVNVELVLCPGGTGEMTSKLQDKSLDLAIALTEGLVAGISKGQDWYKIVGTYVDAPLCWALSAGKNSKHDSIDTLHKTNVAISRYGSGSHIMAFVLADQREWLKKDEKPFDFTVLNNFKAMRDAVNDGSCDYFMWETFTTKPYHDSGEVKRIGQITPPWPAFMFAAHTDLLNADKDGLKKVLGATQRATQLFMEQKEDESVKHVMRILEYPEEDVRRWFKTVHYASNHQQVSRKALDVTLSTLLKADVVSEPTKKIEELVDLQVAELIE
ncbi:periplasmic binding protein-like II [Mucor ambiguus]|uniref:Periplasmic binding protein-like II n=1 Tax=Mucor ambiguus TaxID=91626 RepID=A0A0C9MB84_9FUNG|nr:periplasmic binding protein-like II [Mucor ambiguus]